MPRERLFSVTAKDLVIETFRAGGRGGQHQNKVESGVRIRHPASGAVAEAREERSQLHNKHAALRRLAQHPRFLAWVRLEAARRLGRPDPETIVEAQMAPHLIRVEVKDEAGRWVEAPDPLEDEEAR